MNREISLYRYLCQNEGWQHRRKIMHWTGFPDPDQYQVTAYVEFANSVMRLNARLARVGKQITRYMTADSSGCIQEFYRVTSVERAAA